MIRPSKYQCILFIQSHLLQLGPSTSGLPGRPGLPQPFPRYTPELILSLHSQLIMSKSLSALEGLLLSSPIYPSHSDHPSPAVVPWEEWSRSELRCHQGVPHFPFPCSKLNSLLWFAVDLKAFRDYSSSP